jgi:glucokinase
MPGKADMPFLVADIGGTHARFRLVERRGVDWMPVHEARCLTADFEGAPEAMRGFLESAPKPARRTVRGACLAVAAPVRDGRASMTNLGWRLDAARLAREFAIGFVDLVNDLEAVALAVPRLAETALDCIRPGIAANGPALALGPGTGLGQVMFHAAGNDVAIHASEGGHAAFAPLDEEQDRLLAYLRARIGRVSYEHLLSGRGLTTLYRFSCERRGSTSLVGEGADRGADVVAAARAGDAAADAAIESFWSILGAFAGDGVLAYLASGGVYLVGGILPKLPRTPGQQAFCRAFAHKGVMSGVVAGVPVQLVTADDVGLIGAQAFIERRLGGRAAARGPGKAGAWTT